MELREYVALVWRWLWLMVLGAVVAGASAYLISRNQVPIYRSTSVLLVSEGAADSNEYRSLLVGEQLAQSYVRRLSNYQVLTEAISNLGLDMDPNALQRQMQVSVIDETQLIALSISHPSPETASALANEIPLVFEKRNLAQQLERFSGSKENLEAELAALEAEMATAEADLAAEKASQPQNQGRIEQANNNLLRLRDTHSRLLESYENVRIAEASGLDTIILDEVARPSYVPISPRTTQNTLLAAVVGVMLAAGIAFLVEYLDDSVKSPRQLEQLTGLSPLGSIERLKIDNVADALVAATDPRAPAAEAFRHIRTNIQYISVDRPLKTILITSANMGEGKSTVAANLGMVLAQSGKRVILVDADMRRPNLHKIMEVDGTKGLANLIIRGREDTSFLKGTLITNLRVLPAGRIPPNPAELLGSERMRDVFAWLQEQADYVIFDSPPLLAVTDGAVLSKLVDTTLFVVTEKTRLPAFDAAVKQIQALEGNIAGVILNKVSLHRGNGYYHHYYYQNNYTPTAEPDESWALSNGRKSWKQWVQQALYSVNLFQ